jgi:hypothetical protein
MEGRKMHPVRGVIGGILFGLGLAMVLVSLGVIAFGTTALWIVMVLGFAAVVAWSTVGPVRGSGEPGP